MDGSKSCYKRSAITLPFEQCQVRLLLLLLLSVTNYGLRTRQAIDKLSTISVDRKRRPAAAAITVLLYNRFDILTVFTSITVSLF